MSPDSELSLESRMKGAFWGLVVGDAFGAPYEFYNRGQYNVQDHLISNPNSKLQIKKGEWTDDSSMALALADSLISCNGFDPVDLMERFRRWAYTKNGYCSSRDTAFGFGQTFLSALWQAKDNPYPGMINPKRAGNGSIMRLAPVPIYFFNDLKATVEFAGKSSMVTHGHPESIYAARLFAKMLHDAFCGNEKTSIMIQEPENEAPEVIQDIAIARYQNKPLDEIEGTFFAAKSLEAALWCFYHTDSYRDAIKLAVELGGDTDSTAAVCGQIAGGHYGFDSIPKEWVEDIVKWEQVAEIIDRFVCAAIQRSNCTFAT